MRKTYIIVGNEDNGIQIDEASGHMIGVAQESSLFSFDLTKCSEADIYEVEQYLKKFRESGRCIGADTIPEPPNTDDIKFESLIYESFDPNIKPPLEGLEAPEYPGDTQSTEEETKDLMNDIKSKLRKKKK